MQTPQESRELFADEVAFALNHPKDFDPLDAALTALDTYTHSLITNAMQQIEASKFPEEVMPKGLYGPSEAKQMAAMVAHNSAHDQDITILQSLLPEQNIKK